MANFAKKKPGMVPGRAPAPAGPVKCAGVAAPPGAGPQDSAGAVVKRWQVWHRKFL